MSTPRGAWPLIVAALIGAGLFLVPTASARPKAPSALVPASGKVVEQLPVFTWARVKNADHYEFQLAADKGFNSIIANDGKIATNNTAVTVPHAAVNATYWWRVRTVTASAATSAWTKSRSVSLKWAPVTNLVGPSSGTPFSTPSVGAGNAPVLRWAPMPGAAQYAVSIASDPLLGTLVTPNAKPEVTDNTAYTLNGMLSDNTYYWSVTPLDAEGHKGPPSAIRTFSVRWDASTGSPTVTDLAAGDDLTDPLFSWSAVLGAASYGVEISTSSDFSAGSKVCCDGRTTGTSFSPKQLLPNNNYYWRVQPFTAGGAAGPWTLGNGGGSVAISFDNPPSGPAIKNLEMRDMTDVGSNSGAMPVVTWDPVMGASAYEIEIDGWLDAVGPLPAHCNTSDRWGDFVTGVPAWSALGSLGGFAPQIGNASNPSTDSNFFSPHTSYCVQVRAINSDQDRNEVYGDWTVMNDGNTPAFTTNTVAASTNPGCGGGAYLCSGDYISPIGGVHETTTPSLFVWKRIVGANGYYVVVSRDPSFSNILDYAYTYETAYAPRTGNGILEYADESAGSTLYWAVLPASGGTPLGTAASIATLASKQTFAKQSDQPFLYAPSQDASGVSFRWEPQMGAAYYSIQVSTDPNFSSTLEDQKTDSASYTAATSYPAGQTLFYRVRANDVVDNGLAWNTGQFSRSLPAPVLAAASGDVNATRLDGVPTWSWTPLAGAVSYDIHIDKADATTQDVNVIPTTNAWLKFDGPGVWKWKVRAQFSTNGNNTIPGPYSPVQTFTRTFGEPVGARAVQTASRLIFSWNPKQGAKTYHLQVATDADFQSIVDDVTQDSSHFAPTLTNDAYKNGGRLFWHVAAIDAENNAGDWTRTLKVSLAKGLRISSSPAPAKSTSGLVTITITNVKGAPVKGVTVRVSGAGAIPRSKKTNKKGIVVLRVRPTSVGGLIFRATRQGYQLATITDVIS